MPLNMQDVQNKSTQTCAYIWIVVSTQPHFSQYSSGREEQPDTLRYSFIKAFTIWQQRYLEMWRFQLKPVSISLVFRLNQTHMQFYIYAAYLCYSICMCYDYYNNNYYYSFPLSAAQQVVSAHKLVINE